MLSYLSEEENSNSFETSVVVENQAATLESSGEFQTDENSYPTQGLDDKSNESTAPEAVAGYESDGNSNLNQRLINKSSRKVAESKKRRKTPWTEYEELLIEEVRKRVPLWDHQLPVAMRGPLNIKELWEEVEKSLECKKHFYLFIYSFNNIK